MKVTHSLRLTPLTLLLLMLSFGGLITAQAAPTPAEYGTVLNLSGKQRMLSQKMSKEVCLIALDLNKADNLSNLSQTASLFQQTLSGLRNGDASLGLPATDSPRILRQLDKIDELWLTFNQTIQAIISSGEVSDSQLEAIALANPELLQQMNKAVNLYEKDAQKGGLEADPALATTLNLSGKQRMLSQKMSKEFLLIALGHQVDDNKLNLLETYNLFDQTLKGLADGDAILGLPSTPQPHIRKQLEVVDALWQGFKPLMAQAASHDTQTISRAQLEKVAEYNLPLLQEMNKAVGMYEKEAGK